MILLAIFMQIAACAIADDDTDSSGFSTDGPIVIYADNVVRSYLICCGTDSPSVKIEKAHKESRFRCFEGDNSREFEFSLRASLETEQDTYETPEKMLVISDIEGNFDGFASILKAGGVTDNEMNWSFGNGHLVLLGDFFDRGLYVTECLWLIYKLESEAKSAGGKVHFILGNHEVMNMRGDLRYVRKKYFANADSLGLSYDMWYSADSELGSWLRTKNSIEKIGDVIFVHGGLSSELMELGMSINEINTRIRELTDMKAGNRSDSILLGRYGPLWYRGIAKTEVDDKTLDNLLNYFGSDKMVIAHTIFDSISYLYGGKAIAIDLDHEENYKNGKMFALWYENGKFSVIDNESKLHPVTVL